jgi:beta-lactamase class A
MKKYMLLYEKRISTYWRKKMKEIKRYLDDRMGDYSFYFEDLDCGYVYAHNENVEMTSAGCIKLPISLALLKEVENNKTGLNDKIKITGEDMVYGTGIIHEFGEKEYTVLELMVAMLIQSDNTAANKIIDIIGMKRINELIKEMGLENTALNRKSKDERLGKKGIENISSSADLSKCWKLLYNTSFLNKEHSSLIIDILKRQQIKNKIAFYMPDSVKQNIASKSGDLETVENDTALMMVSKGNFVFTVMSKNLPNSIYGMVTLSRIGKMMWDMINNNWN